MANEVACSDCGTELTPTQDGPCPACGGTARTVKALLTDSLSLTASERLTDIEKHREFYEKNSPILWAVIAITVVGSVLGLVLSGWPGVVAGLVLGALSYYLGPRAVIKIREINHTHFE
jgi:hypothetical protein